MKRGVASLEMTLFLAFFLMLGGTVYSVFQFIRSQETWGTRKADSSVGCQLFIDGLRTDARFCWKAEGTPEKVALFRKDGSTITYRVASGTIVRAAGTTPESVVLSGISSGAFQLWERPSRLVSVFFFPQDLESPAAFTSVALKGRKP